MRTLEKQRKPKYALSAAAFCVLLLRPLYASFLIAPAVTMLLITALPVRETAEMNSVSDKGRRGRIIAAVLLALFFAALFLIVWLRTKQLVSLHFFRWKEALLLMLEGTSNQKRNRAFHLIMGLLLYEEMLQYRKNGIQIIIA